jgi:phage shock protein A
MAEDFYEQFGLGTGNTSIGVQDLAGVSIAAVKELDQQLQQKSSEVESLKVEVDRLKKENATVQQRIAALEQAILKATQNK